MTKHLVPLLLCALAPWLHGQSVTVDAATNVVLDDQPRIGASLFGITAFEGGPAMVADRDYWTRVAALRPGCIRYAGNLAWVLGKEPRDPDYFATPAAHNAFNQALLFGSRYPTGRFLPLTRQLGAEPMCSLGGVPAWLQYEKTRNPADFDRWAALCAGYVGLWREADPDFRLVQIWNEPNASWFRDPRASDKGNDAANLHIQMANKVARAIKQAYPDMLVGGPVLCWAPGWPPNQKGKRPWYTWNDWTLPWLKGTKDTIDFFDFHVYSISPDDFVVQTEMLANAAERLQGRRLPVWITESNCNLKKEELNDGAAIWEHRIVPYARFLLQGIVPQADKIHGNLYHDLHARRHTLLPHGPDDPDPAYWLLWVLRDLRGLRLRVDTGVPDVIATATMEDDRVTVVLLNDSDEAREIPLTVNMPCGYWTGPSVRLMQRGDSGTAEPSRARLKFQRQGGTASGSVALGPHAIASVNFRMDRFGTPRRTIRLREHFGDRNVAFLKADAPTEATIALPAERPGTWHLRLGLLGPDGSESLRLVLNGKTIPIQATALQELPVDSGLLKEANRMSLTLDQPTENPKLALGFVSLVQATTGK
jgi:hypothetical protein